MAAGEGDLSRVKILLEQGAQIASKDARGHNALHIAVCGGHMEVAQLLAEMGPDLIRTRTNNHGLTALHFAAIQDFESIVQLLVERDLSLVREKTHDGRTALGVAAGENIKRILREAERKLSGQSSQPLSSAQLLGIGNGQHSAGVSPSPRVPVARAQAVQSGSSYRGSAAASAVSPLIMPP